MNKTPWFATGFLISSFFFTKIRKIFTVRRKTRKLSKIRKTYAKNVRLDRYDVREREREEGWGCGGGGGGGGA